jgi:PIN like domain
VADSGAGVVFLFDENAPWRLVRSLRELGQAAWHVNDVGLRGAPDQEMLRYAGERGWAVVGSDRQILHRPHERAVLREMNMGAFFFNDTISGLCKISRTVYRHWPEMKRLAGTLDRPYLNLIRETTITPIRRKRLGAGG